MILHRLSPTVTLYHGDCLDVMPRLATGSVDLILCDLPYGTTACSWDAVIPFDRLWAEYRRVLRPGGVVVLTAAQPFTTQVMRRKNTRPTLIYWLLDIRPETIAAGWPVGKPFYCGKTVSTTNDRLRGHRECARRFPAREISKRLAACGEHVSVLTMETVPVEGDWRARERHWIKILRFSFPDVANISAGGHGTVGMVHSAETRAKISTSKAGKPGKPRSAETRAKISAIHKGRKLAPEVIARRTETRKNWKPSPDHLAKLCAGHAAYWGKTNA